MKCYSELKFKMYNSYSDLFLFYKQAEAEKSPFLPFLCIIGIGNNGLAVLGSLMDETKSIVRLILGEGEGMKSSSNILLPLGNVKIAKRLQNKVKTFHSEQNDVDGGVGSVQVKTLNIINQLLCRCDDTTFIRYARKCEMFRWMNSMKTGIYVEMERCEGETNTFSHPPSALGSTIPYCH